MNDEEAPSSHSPEEAPAGRLLGLVLAASTPKTHSEKTWYENNQWWQFIAIGVDSYQNSITSFTGARGSAGDADSFLANHLVPSRVCENTCFI